MTQFNKLEDIYIIHISWKSIESGHYQTKKQKAENPRQHNSFNDGHKPHTKPNYQTSCSEGRMEANQNVSYFKQYYFFSFSISYNRNWTLDKLYLLQPLPTAFLFRTHNETICRREMQKHRLLNNNNNSISSHDLPATPTLPKSHGWLSTRIHLSHIMS